MNSWKFKKLPSIPFEKMTLTKPLEKTQRYSLDPLENFVLTPLPVWISNGIDRYTLRNLLCLPRYSPDFGSRCRKLFSISVLFAGCLVRVGLPVRISKAGCLGLRLGSIACIFGSECVFVEQNGQKLLGRQK